MNVHLYFTYLVCCNGTPKKDHMNLILLVTAVTFAIFGKSALSSSSESSSIPSESESPVTSATASLPNDNAPQKSTNSQQPANSAFKLPTINQAIAESFYGFANNLFNNATKEKLQNVVMSPFAIQAGLTLMYCGAEGQTASELQSGLQFNKETIPEITYQYKTILGPLKNSSSVQLANAIYYQDGLTLNSNFSKIATNDFYSHVRSIDFGDGQYAAEKINNWMANKTHNLITNLVPGYDLDQNTKLVLVNALYFHQLWAYPFSKLNTKHEEFYMGACSEDSQIINPSKKAYMMERTGISAPHGYIKELNANVVQLPFVNSDVKMTVILPSTCDGITNLQSAIQNYDLLSIADQLESGPINVKLPKFNLYSYLKLNTILSKMGIDDLFWQANFTGIFSENVDISNIFTRSVIRLSEGGVLATSATAITADNEAQSPLAKNPWFIANHPFLFMINTPQEVFFMGRVYEP